jgi:thiosulfate/3-mercaptopyruvate sulfurtransferase
MLPIISVKELSAIAGQPGVIIVDTRSELGQPEAGRLAYAAGHIPGARFADADTVVCGFKTGTNGRHPMPSMAVFCERMRALGISRESRVIVYDGGSASFAARLWFSLRAAGLASVQVLDGGFDAWTQQGMPVSQEVPSFSEGNFTAGTPLEVIVRVDRVEANVLSHSFLLVDARAHERYLGQSESIDPKAGHIPGAVNRPCSENMENGVFKSPEELARAFAPIVQKAAGRPIVNYCGSGITACNNHLAMRIAGLEPAGVYIGSWSEWCADPKHEIALGEEE